MGIGSAASLTDRSLALLSPATSTPGAPPPPAYFNAVFGIVGWGGRKSPGLALWISATVVCAASVITAMTILFLEKNLGDNALAFNAIGGVSTGLFVLGNILLWKRSVSWAREGGFDALWGVAFRGDSGAFSLRRTCFGITVLTAFVFAMGLCLMVLWIIGLVEVRDGCYLLLTAAQPMSAASDLHRERPSFAGYIVAGVMSCVCLPLTLYPCAAAVVVYFFVCIVTFCSVHGIQAQLTSEFLHEDGPPLTRIRVRAYLKDFSAVAAAVRSYAQTIEIPLFLVLLVNLFDIVLNWLLLLEYRFGTSQSIVLRLIGPGNDFGSLYAHIIAMLALTLSVHLYLVPGFLVTTSSRSLNRTIGACMARQLGSIDLEHGDATQSSSGDPFLCWQSLITSVRAVEFSWRLVGIEIGPYQGWLLLSGTVSTILLALTGKA